MINGENQLRVSLQQLQRVIEAIRSAKAEVLPKNADLFASLVEGYVEELARIQQEVDEYLSAPHNSVR